MGHITHEAIILSAVIVDSCHYTFLNSIEYTIQIVNPHANYSLLLIIVEQYQLTNCSKGTTLVQDIKSRRNKWGWGKGEHGISLYFLVNFLLLLLFI